MGAYFAFRMITGDGSGSGGDEPGGSGGNDVFYGIALVVAALAVVGFTLWICGAFD